MEYSVGTRIGSLFCGYRDEFGVDIVDFCLGFVSFFFGGSNRRSASHIAVVLECREVMSIAKNEKEAIKNLTFAKIYNETYMEEERGISI
jgi:hypothetical protein